MSSTNRGATRDPHDYYRTPAWCTRAIVERLTSPRNVVDVGCGDGAIMGALPHAAHREIIGVEVQAHLASQAREATGNEVLEADYLAPGLELPFRPDLVIGNPPYAQAMAFVKRSLEFDCMVVMLLRLAWTASQKRNAFHLANPCDLYILPRRPSFTGGGTDSADYAWFVWGDRGGTWEVIPVEDCK